ncbi:MAG: leucine-rich repeat protein, partial [Clostridia bacterium]|nr:leucine-rich repeat protein [Clostridia bacterium]
RYRLVNPVKKELDASCSAQHTFTEEKTYALYATYNEGSESKAVYLFIDAVDRTAELGQKVTEIAEACRQSGAESDYERALWLHDWLTAHACYDQSLTEYGPDGVLLKGCGLCDSYSKAYQMLLNEFGIPNHRQAGTAGSVPHGWNVVKLDENWCHIDVTWDDPPGSTDPVSGEERHTYFGLPGILIGTNHDYNIVYSCDAWDNIYFVRYGLPSVYSRLIDEKLAAQAAQGLETISVDVSAGYCTSWSETEPKKSTVDAKIIFPIMAYLKSRTPLTGPEGEDVYYTFSYSDKKLIGIRTGESAAQAPVLKVTYSVDGETIQPGSTFDVGRTLTVNWSAANIPEREDGKQARLTFERSAELGPYNTVDARLLPVEGSMDISIQGKYASGSFTLTPGEGDVLHLEKSLTLPSDPENAVCREMDTFYLTGSETEPLQADVVFTQDPASRTISAEILTAFDGTISLDWYWDLKDPDHILARDCLSGSARISECFITRNVEDAVILDVAFSSEEKGLSYRRDFEVTPEGFEALPENACGYDLSWNIENGKLILTGSGAMFDYPEGGAPWYARRSEITAIQFPESITHIGNSAFEKTRITEVTIPETVETIGRDAFHGCDLLATVRIPKNVRQFEDAFYCNPGLMAYTVDAENPYFRSVNGIVLSKDGKRLMAIPEGVSHLVIPDGVTEIPYLRSFTQSRFSILTIPASVKSLSGSASYEGTAGAQALQEIEYQGTRREFSEIRFTNEKGQVLTAPYLPEHVTLYCASTPADRVLVIPSALQTIEEEAFRGISAEEVILPDGMKSIGAYAFAGNASLVIIHIPSTVTSIDDSAFADHNPRLLILCDSGSVAEAYAMRLGIFCETEK